MIDLEAYLGKQIPTSATYWENGIEILTIPENLTDVSFLDIGGGASDITANLLLRGANAFSIDPAYKSRSDLKGRILGQLKPENYTKENIARIRQGLETFMQSIKTNPNRYRAEFATHTSFQDNFFDYIYSINLVTAYLDIDLDTLNRAVDESIRISKPGATIQYFPFLEPEPSGSLVINTQRIKNDQSLLDRLSKDTRIKDFSVREIEFWGRKTLTLIKSDY